MYLDVSYAHVVDDRVLGVVAAVLFIVAVIVVAVVAVVVRWSLSEEDDRVLQLNIIKRARLNTKRLSPGSGAQ